MLSLSAETVKRTWYYGVIATAARFITTFCRKDSHDFRLRGSGLQNDTGSRTCQDVLSSYKVLRLAVNQYTCTSFNQNNFCALSCACRDTNFTILTVRLDVRTISFESGCTVSGIRVCELNTAKLERTLRTTGNEVNTVLTSRSLDEFNVHEIRCQTGCNLLAEICTGIKSGKRSCIDSHCCNSSCCKEEKFLHNALF